VAVVIPVTATGAVLLISVLSPSPPELLLPQHLIEPLLKSAQEWKSPTAIAVADEIPVTVTGIELLVVEPLPS
jgi:hypothetical protein